MVQNKIVPSAYACISHVFVIVAVVVIIVVVVVVVVEPNDPVENDQNFNTRRVLFCLFLFK